MMASSILQAKQSPKGNEKLITSRVEKPAEQFLKNLRAQIRHCATVWIVLTAGGISLLGMQGCIQKKEIMPPVGKWKREATYLNGKFNHERRATLTLTQSSFRLQETNCETVGKVSYQQKAMIVGVQQTDCPGFSANEKIYYGYGIDPDDGSLKIFRNNQYYDEIREVYRRIE